eukprot:1044323-Amphidinium_carterae.1
MRGDDTCQPHALLCGYVNSHTLLSVDFHATDQRTERRSAVHESLTVNRHEPHGIEACNCPMCKRRISPKQAS